MSNPYLSAFNNQFMEFVEDVLILFPNDPDLIASKNTILLMKKFNPRIIITTWRDLIAIPYHKEIEEEGFDFFISKDYSQDLKDMPDSDKTLQIIERFRSPLRNLHDNDKITTMKYVNNMVKLSLLYK
tara:strand:+ start:186 stop:569 length:384 start_codon:yes stop_codon:yes gene_type:complete